MPEDLPIFFDRSGKRWFRAKIFSFLFIIFFIIAAFLLISRAIEPVRISRPSTETPISVGFPARTESPADLAYSISAEQNLPIIGEGIFLRVVGIHHWDGRMYAADVYSGMTTKEISPEETDAIGTNKYAIERYGPSDGKRIVLTFDDGPHPIYTPQILDILSRESAHSSFFPIGANIVKHPDIVRRASREGHDVANHTFSHADLDLISSLRARQEINQTQRIIREVTGRSPSIFRIPYGGHDDASVRDDRRAILEAQSLGYAVASYDIDTVDWGFDQGEEVKVPELDGQDHVILLHDGGGNRSQTVAYMQELIKKAKAAGYEFTSLSRMYSDYGLNNPADPAIADKASFYAASAVVAWPKKLLNVLFIISVVLIFLSVILGIVLAELQMVVMRPPRRRRYSPLVSVIIPAYNEEKVLRRTVRSVKSSFYGNLEIIVIDDGSTDNTWRIIKNLKKEAGIRGMRQPNMGKSAAVNRGISMANGEIFVSIDADTVFEPRTIGRLVRYFYYPDIGAVAGVVKVGNVRNWITRWQALEYITSINIERAAQAFIRSIVVAPGACSAWRKEAVQKAGGYSSATMAEDCDLTLAVRKAGYSVVQDMEAVAYTECPETIRGLARQRFRWLFGNIQAIWKHKDIIFRPRYGWLGFYVIPKTVLGIVMQLVFAPLLLFVSVGNILAGEALVILLYSSLSIIVLAITAVVALLFAHERFSYLRATPAFRLVYAPLRTMLIYASVVAALGGLEQGWNKVARTGTAINVK